MARGRCKTQPLVGLARHCSCSSATLPVSWSDCSAQPLLQVYDGDPARQAEIEDAKRRVLEDRSSMLRSFAAQSRARLLPATDVRERAAADTSETDAPHVASTPPCGETECEADDVPKEAPPEVVKAPDDDAVASTAAREGMVADGTLAEAVAVADAAEMEDAEAAAEAAEAAAAESAEAEGEAERAAATAVVATVAARSSGDGAADVAVAVVEAEGEAADELAALEPLASVPRVASHASSLSSLSTLSSLSSEGEESPLRRRDSIGAVEARSGGGWTSNPSSQLTEGGGAAEQANVGLHLDATERQAASLAGVQASKAGESGKAKGGGTEGEVMAWGAGAPERSESVAAPGSIASPRLARAVARAESGSARVTAHSSITDPRSSAGAAKVVDEAAAVAPGAERESSGSCSLLSCSDTSAAEAKEAIEAAATPCAELAPAVAPVLSLPVTRAELSKALMAYGASLLDVSSAGDALWRAQALVTPHHIAL